MPRNPKNTDGLPNRATETKGKKVKRTHLLTNMKELQEKEISKQDLKEIIAYMGYDIDETTPISAQTILNASGLSTAQWALGKAFGEKGKKILHISTNIYSKRILPIFEIYYPKEKRFRKYIELKRKWIEGKASDEQLIKTREEALLASTGKSSSEKNDAGVEAGFAIIESMLIKDEIKMARWTTNFILSSIHRHYQNSESQVYHAYKEFKKQKEILLKLLEKSNG